MCCDWLIKQEVGDWSKFVKMELRLRVWVIFLFVISQEVEAIPQDWIEYAKQGRYMISTTPPLDGLYPSFSNGFLAGDSGCSNISNPSTKGGSCGRVYLAGVFNNETYY